MTILVAGTQAHVQRLFSVVIMATVFVDCISEEQRSVVRFLLAKGLIALDMHKEIFPVYCGKCLSRKAVHSWVEKFSQGHSKITDDAGPSMEVAETTVKRHTHTHTHIYVYMLRVSTHW
jgi:hypothetical protein